MCACVRAQDIKCIILVPDCHDNTALSVTSENVPTGLDLPAATLSTICALSCVPCVRLLPFISPPKCMHTHHILPHAQLGRAVRALTTDSDRAEKETATSVSQDWKRTEWH